MKLSERMSRMPDGSPISGVEGWWAERQAAFADEVALLEAKNEQLMGEPCSICGQQPSVLMDARYKGTYWKCHECIREDLYARLVAEATS